MSERDELLAVADRIERLAGASTGGDWRGGGLLATRPDVVAHFADGSTEHVAEARARSARWIAVFSPAVAGPLVEWLRSAARAAEVDPAALALARVVQERLG
ncbi:hypothetical protein SAMN02982929_05802 [Saccharopolyspora kobensis]|uniref:Uncharacterized protein n=1 Tax=Saccharopolyspora kobensis TaxID=146035 RepID=A0A1H6E886_9PSEU|nr:hypothetical protein [Saccharopolyspora kobensis]SEG93359.1 hypothetical protein SAMN02982929_05802 [Saccharopolyspora kobensis]SFD44555.1 hypothetical protein SAMN05216506_104332 [Saccharopolyspora kobensis]